MESPSSAVAQANWAETHGVDEPAESTTARETEPNKHTKSRNGCVTCKARRRKCDEAKPSCSQCARRRVPCGGYITGLRWKEFAQPEPSKAPSGRKGTSRSSRQRRATVESPGSRVDQTTLRLPDPTAEMLSVGQAESLEPLVDMDLLLAEIHAALDGPSGLEDNSPLVDYRLVNGDEDDAAGIPSFFQSNADAGPETVGLDMLGPEDGDTTATATGWQLPFEAMATAASSSSSSSSAASSSSTTAKLAHTLYQHPRLHCGSPEHIAFLFNRRICEVLCIRDDSAAGNPWRRIVWPLAQDHAALYHAIAAMTCFQGANRLPQFRAEGLRHLNTSIQQMYGSRGENANNSNMRLEVALAVTLVLGFAETWYYPRSSTGIRFVQRAKGLLQKALCDKNNDGSSDLACLRFLANTWVYMDVISRFTCRGVQLVDTRFMAAWRRLDPQPHTAARRQEVDPLMGTAATLFPLIGRVADLVNRVHGAVAAASADADELELDLNPPGLVAEAVQLKMAMERWRPADTTDDDDDFVLNADSATSSSSSSSASDLVQTADAYKWAALLLLHQAVPELPRPRARLPARLARRVLVLLATVPLGSRAVIFPVLPLLIAGCEADDCADRDWVRQRWHALATGNSSGIVDRCLELTLEVWRRRDHDVHWHRRRRQQHRPQADPIPDWTQDPLFDSNTSSSPLPDDGDLADPFVLPPWPAATAAPFSESLQPAQPEEPVCSPTPTPEYTVKSKQHWLSVMRDWGWEVMLG